MSVGRVKAFTLIELLIVVAVIAILAAIAYPSYWNTVLQARRSDAFSGLMECAAAQERWYTVRNTYADADTSTANGFCSVSPDGYYTLSVANEACSRTVGGVTYYSCFTVTATAGSKGRQSRDDACFRLTINERGQKRAFTRAGDQNSQCWK